MSAGNVDDWESIEIYPCQANEKRIQYYVYHNVTDKILLNNNTIIT